MILAIKDTMACYYNKPEEKEELLLMFKSNEYEVFSDEDIKKAQIYANVKTIKGFKTNIMNSYQILKELKNEGKQAIEFITTKEKRQTVVLNDIYFLCTRSYLNFNKKLGKFEMCEYRGYAFEIVEFFTNKILEYALETKTSFSKATYQYFNEFYKSFGYYPWRTMYAADFYFEETDLPFGEDNICFEYIGDSITEQVSEPKFNFSINNPEHNIKLKEYEINKIKDPVLYFNFKERTIINVIENNFVK